VAGGKCSIEHRKKLSESGKKWWSINKDTDAYKSRVAKIGYSVKAYWEKNPELKEKYSKLCKEQKPLNKGTGTYHKCSECGNDYYEMLSQTKLFCSRKCYLTKLRRDGSHLKKESKLHKGTHIVKKRILEKRHFCDRCGFSDKRILEIHHKDKNRKNNDEDNILLLCPNCHAILHYDDKSGPYRFLSKNVEVYNGR